MASRLRSVARVLSRRRRFEAEMSEELRLHIEEHTEHLVGLGVPPAEAARQARREFGSVLNVESDCREARGVAGVDEVVRQGRHAFRRLRRAPGFTLTALSTLGLCLGASLTLFAVVDSVLLRPLPFPAPDRLVRVFNSYPNAGVPDDGANLTNYAERSGRIAAFADLALYRHDAAVVGETGSTERLPVTRVTADFFDVLGVAPALGRGFEEGETRPGADGVVVLTDGYWRQRLDGDPGALGGTVRVDGVAKRVVGVLPPSFRFLSSGARLYLPYTMTPEQAAPGRRHAGSSSQMIARLHPGVAPGEAQAQVAALDAALGAGSPDAELMARAGFRSRVVPLHADHVASIRPVLLLLSAGALLLLVIGAVNLVDLLLVRASARSRALGIRRALGASRRHLVSEVLVETTVLALGGGLLGLALGAAGVEMVGAFGGDHLPLGAGLAYGPRTALVALAASLAMAAVLGLPVAVSTLRGGGTGGRGAPGPLAAEARGGTANAAAQRLRHGFVVAQIALAFVLIAGAGVLGSSLAQAMAVAPGFEPDHVLSAQVSLSSNRYHEAGARPRFVHELAEAMRREPGVVTAGVISNVPLSGDDAKSSAHLEGFVPEPGEPPSAVYSYSVGGDALAALGVPLRAGRYLASGDAERPARVCVVDEDFAARYFPDGGAVGERLYPGSAPTSGGDDPADACTIVGVVGAVKQAGLTADEALGAVYYRYRDRPMENVYLVARTTVPPASLASGLQAAVRRIDPDLPLTDVRSMDERLSDSLTLRRSPALLAALFAGFALLLTVIGTYGVLSYAVAERRREIGLRMALGARPEQVRRQFVGIALRLVALGTALGLVAAAVATGALRSVLFGVPAFPIAILAGTAAVMVAVSLAACLVPSSRAARIPPTVALSE